MSSQQQDLNLRDPLPLALIPALASIAPGAAEAVGSMMGIAGLKSPFKKKGGSKGVILTDASTGLVLGRISRRRALRVLQKRPMRGSRRTRTVIVKDDGSHVIV